jgi:hypothetical protein
MRKGRMLGAALIALLLTEAANADRPSHVRRSRTGPVWGTASATG